MDTNESRPVSVEVIPDEPGIDGSAEAVAQQPFGVLAFEVGFGMHNIGS